MINSTQWAWSGIVLVYLLNYILDSFANQCEQIDYSKYVLRTSTTIYDDVRGRNLIDHEGCDPHQIWALFRHGIRNNYEDSSTRIKALGLEYQSKIIEAFERGQGTLCPEDIEVLRSWHFDDLVTHESKLITINGKKELNKLGSRIRDTFPTLLNRTYDSEQFHFGYASSQRTIATYRSIVEAIFQYDANFQSYRVGSYDDVVEFDCSLKIMKQYEDLYELYPQSMTFAKESGLFEKIIDNLANRTGIHKNHFDEKFVRTFYEACTYESAKNSVISPWCRVFNLDDLRWMGYREEYFHYSQVSYGSKYIEKFGCIQMKSLISTLDRSVQDKSHKNVLAAFFGHDATIEEIISRLGCFKDPVPITSHYSLFDKDRKWEQSKITPFQANILAVLYRCNDVLDDFKLQFYLNEKPIGCCMTNSTKACSWNMFKETMIDFVKNCKEDYCEEENKPASESSATSSYLNSLNIFINLLVFFKICNYLF